ncbi:MAG TPA: phosphate acyltransferase [Burkholderiales bacterium]|nr:phosphate acyltransferase [Burkholderiales bacterium]
MAPDLEAGNMLAKQLEQLTDAISGGVALGARVPVVVLNRGDAIEYRIASCVLAQLVADRGRAVR